MSYFDFDKLNIQRKGKNCFPIRKLKSTDLKTKKIHGFIENETYRGFNRIDFTSFEKKIRGLKSNRNFNRDACSPVIIQLKEKSRELLSPFSNLSLKLVPLANLQPVLNISKLPGLIPRSRTRPKIRFSPTNA